MTIGNKIADLRKEQKLTQKDLAEKLNVSDKAVSRWETGVTLPDVEMMKKLSCALNVTISELYDALDEDDGNSDEKDNYERIWQYYDYERIWRYKRSTIISCALFILATVIFLVFFFLAGYDIPSINSDGVHTALIILLTGSSLALASTAVVLQIVGAVSLRSFSETKYYRTLYNDALKKGVTVFAVLCAVCIVVALLPLIILVCI